MTWKMQHEKCGCDIFKDDVEYIVTRRLSYGTMAERITDEKRSS